MRALLAVAAAPLLLSATDGYRFEAERAAETSPVMVRMTTYRSTADLRRAAQGYEFTARQVATMQAFSRRRGRWCHIHIVDPAVCYRPAMLGHEALHCFYRDWHPRQDRKRRPLLADRCG